MITLVFLYLINDFMFGISMTTLGRKKSLFKLLLFLFSQVHPFWSTTYYFSGCLRFLLCLSPFFEMSEMSVTNAVILSKIIFCLQKVMSTSSIRW